MMAPKIPQIKIPKEKVRLASPLAPSSPWGEEKNDLTTWAYVEKDLDMPYEKKHKMSI